MVARNRTRAARRIAERTRRNAEAVAAGIELAEDRPKRRRVVRFKTQLETLEARSAITMEQKRAGERLAQDYASSNSTIGRLTASYEPRLRSKSKYQQTPDTPLSVAARERYDNALKEAGLGSAAVGACYRCCARPPS
jgi:hypothetical protein